MLLPALLLAQMAQVAEVSPFGHSTPLWKMSLEPHTAQFVAWGCGDSCFLTPQNDKQLHLKSARLQSQCSLAAAPATV